MRDDLKLYAAEAWACIVLNAGAAVVGAAKFNQDAARVAPRRVEIVQRPAGQSLALFDRPTPQLPKRVDGFDDDRQLPFIPSLQRPLEVTATFSTYVSAIA